MKTAQNKAIQIFNFIKALYELKFPIVPDIKKYDWKLSFEDIPEYKAISIGQPFTQTVNETKDYIIKVRRPVINPCPSPPDYLLDWLDGDWNDPTEQISYKENKLDIKNSTEQRFDEDDERVKSYKAWVQNRSKWAESEIIIRRALMVYERLYSLYTLINREGDRIELILGDGFFYCPTNGYEHPILLLRVQLFFEPSIPEFTISITDKPTELYSRFIRNIPEIDISKISYYTEKIEEECIYPYEGDTVELLLKEMVQAFSHKGKYLESKDSNYKTDGLIAYRNPILFVRKRESDYISAINKIIDTIKDSKGIPSSIINITGIEAISDNKFKGLEDESLEEKLFKVNGISKDILFSKPANEEQLLIAKKIEASDSVLVQGPPGTGKTHTIANLIGHFMAEGKNVLVTSYSSKALKVLRSQLPKSLQPLCVSLLDESKQQLEEAVNNINSHLTKDNPATLDKMATRLAEQREKLLEELAKEKKTLLEVIKSEYYPLTFAGKDYSPKDAAQFVYNNKETLGWLPGNLISFAPMPLSLEQLDELYSSNGLISVEEEQYLSSEIPDIKELIEPNSIYDGFMTINQEDCIDGCEYWCKTESDGNDSLQYLKNLINNSIELFRDSKEWMLSAAFAGVNRTYLESWNSLLDGIDELIELGARVSNNLLKKEIYIPADIVNEATVQCFEQILIKSDGHKTIPKLILLFKPEWKQIIEVCRINGKLPNERIHFEELHLYCVYKQKQALMCRLFDRLITSLQGPELQNDGKIEIIIKEWRPIISRYLNWNIEIVENILQLLKELGFKWEDFTKKIPIIPSQYGEIERMINILHDVLPSLVEAEFNRRNVAFTKRRLKTYEQKLKTLPEGTLIRDLISAVHNNDYDKYNESYCRIQYFVRLLPIYKKRVELLNILKEMAPEWALSIKRHEGIHGQSIMPGKPKEAWLWRQLNQELERRLSINVDKVQKRIDELNHVLLDVTEELISKKAWYAELVAVSDIKKRMALSGWAGMVKLIGSGKGKRARALISQAKEQMKLCQDSVPVWIMPLNRVLENFIPGETEFDVVIIDEASQVDALGLVALFLGKKVIVVGDNKQVTPLAVGLDIDIIEQLQNEFLKAIPNAGLYNELLSVYDMAGWSFEPIRLREHFRCATPIIQFSNRHYYGGDIKPMRDCSTVNRKPHTVAYKVEGETEGTKRNLVEADTIVALIKSCMEQKEYEDATFGVLSILGDEQAVLIDEKLRLCIDEGQFDKHKIICGNPSHLQGDERDIVFISMVDSPRDSGGPLNLRQDGYNDIYAKRYNVAASRARDQLWVIYSLNPETDLKPGDIRGNLISHVINPEAVDNIINERVKKAESEFERLVIKALTLKGYSLTSQYPVGTFRLDIVVEYEDRKVAIECDGEKYHGIDKLIEDMARQSILERLGWRFIRIRGSQFFRNQEETMDLVFKALEELSIFSVNHMEIAHIEDNRLKDSIVRRAYEIMSSGEIPAGSSLKSNSSKSRFSRYEKNDVKRKPKENIVSDKGQDINKSKVDTEPKKTIEFIEKKAKDNALQQVSLFTESTDIKNRAVNSNKKKTVSFDIIVFLKQKGYEVIDNREKSRIIWVIGDISSETEFLKNEGYVFQYYARGAIATSGKPAWRCNI